MANIIIDEDCALEEQLVYEYETAIKAKASQAEMQKIYDKMKATMERFNYSGILYAILVDDGQLPEHK